MRHESRPRGATDPDREAARGCPVRASVFTGSGLAFLGLALVAGVVALMTRDPATDEIGAVAGHFHRQPAPISSLGFAPDGESLAVGRADGVLEVRNPALGPPREFGVGPGSPIRSVAFSPDGKWLASAGPGPDVKLWDAATGRPLATLSGHARPACSVAFSPDGRTLASGAVDGTIRLWDPAEGRSRAALDGHLGEVRGLAFAPDGRTLASGSFDGTIRTWDPADGRSRSVLRDEKGQRRVFGLAYSPDGRTLAFGLGASKAGARGMIILWDLVAGREAARTTGHASFATLAFAPDGRTLASAGGDRVVRIWEAGTSRERAVLSGHEGYIDSVAFSPDGRTLATGGQDTLLGLFDLTPRGRPAHRL